MGVNFPARAVIFVREPESRVLSLGHVERSRPVEHKFVLTLFVAFLVPYFCRLVCANTTGRRFDFFSLVNTRRCLVELAGAASTLLGMFSFTFLRRSLFPMREMCAMSSLGPCSLSNQHFVSHTT